MYRIFLISALALGLLASCDPIKEDGSFSVDVVSSEELLSGAIFSQYNDEQCTQPAADGNFIKFDIPNASSVVIYYIKPDGSEFRLSSARSAGVFNYVPLRGSDPNQTIYFRYINPNGIETVASHQFTLQVAAELSAGDKLLCSNNGSKKWKWSATSANGGAVWGNAGYQAGAQAGGADINGAWWGCGLEDGECADKFSKQLQHSAAGAITGEEYSTAYMVFNEDGSLTKYDKDGNKLNSGTFQLTDYKNGEAIDANGNMAYLKTSAGAILWPYAINKGGFTPESFEVAYLSVDRMVLIYADEGTGGWSECTWWSFASDDDAEGFLTSSDWTWKPTSVNGGAVWGNGGYLAGEQSAGDGINGAWWGCGLEDGACADKFSTQLQHSAAGAITGEEYSTAYMSFNEDGSIVKYDKDGAVLNEGTWSLDMTPNADHFSKGTLSTSEGAILWPYAINKGGFTPQSFEIGHVSGSQLILIYADEGTGGWSECTWWSFGKK